MVYLLRAGSAGREAGFRGRYETAVEEQGARRRMLHRLSAGLCVGELGLVNAAPRGASVRALTRVETLTVSAAHFHDLLARSAGLRNHVKTLQRCLALHDDSTAAASARSRVKPMAPGSRFHKSGAC